MILNKSVRILETEAASSAVNILDDKAQRKCEKITKDPRLILTLHNEREGSDVLL